MFSTLIRSFKSVGMFYVFNSINKSSKLYLCLLLFFISSLAKSQNQAGTDAWIGHVYDNKNFTNYKGIINESEVFSEGFGGGWVNLTTSTSSVYTETFSVKFLMNSTKRGLYRVKIVTDDGSKLFVGSKKVFDASFPQGASWHNYKNQLFNLDGNTLLKLEFYENYGGNTVKFIELTRLIENVISGGQKICKGSNGVEIAGDDFQNLPNTYNKVGTGFKWYYSTSPSGVKIPITGGTSKNFTPTNTAPFNQVGEYYVYRKVTLKNSRQKLDGVGSRRSTVFEDFTEQNMSKPVLVEVVDKSNNINAGADGFKGTTYCEGETVMELTFNANDDNAFPYTIKYLDVTNNTTHTQYISGQGSESFVVGNIPTTPGQHTYTLKSIENKYGCIRTTGLNDLTAEITVRKKPSNVLTITKGVNAVCSSGVPPIITLQNSDSKNIIVTYEINNGPPQTIEVDNTETISVPVSLAGVFTYKFTKVKYKSAKYCEENLNKEICVAVFPKNNIAPPTVNSPKNTPITVTPPTTVSGFKIEYSFNDGLTWGTNTPPTTDNCNGYKIKTRYKLTATCAGADKTLACATSPAATRILDKTKPTFTEPTSVEFCVKSLESATYVDATMDIQPTERKDFYIFETGNTQLDVTNMNDNCCSIADLKLSWVITDILTSTVIANGLGQPSLHTDITLQGSSTVNKKYSIKYTLEDCNGNKQIKSVEITIKRRPIIIKN